MAIVEVTPVVDLAVRDLCRAPYPGHPHGCPKYGSRGCPPGCKTVEQVYDMDKQFFIVYTTFNLGEWAAHMHEKHPDWSDPMCRNLRYWQPKARANLRREIGVFWKDHPDMFVACPEALGIDVDATMKTVGVTLEWPPQILTYQVNIAGFFRRRHILQSVEVSL